MYQNPPTDPNGATDGTDVLADPLVYPFSREPEHRLDFDDGVEFNGALVLRLLTRDLCNRG